MGKTRNLFKKIRDTKGTFQEKMGKIKDRNGIHLTEADYSVKKRWQEYTEELHKKILMTQITTMVWWLTYCQTSQSMTQVGLRKHHYEQSYGDNQIPTELFQILKDDAVKVLHSIYQQIWKTQQWPHDWKRSVFVLIPKKGSIKECPNYCTITLITHTSKVMLKNLQDGFNSTWTENFHRFKLYLEMEEESEIKFANIHLFIEKAREFLKNIDFCFIDCVKSFDCVDHNKLWKILKDGNTRPYHLPPERPVCRSRSNS